MANPEGPRLTPQLAYRDIGAALEWLGKAFGFRELEHARFMNSDGTVGHAEMQTEYGAVFMLGQSSGHGLSSPKELGGGTQMLCAYVSDVDAHCEQARAAGAEISAELEDKFWGDRVYEAQDPEGHRWMICQRVRNVPPEEWPQPGK